MNFNGMKLPYQLVSLPDFWLPSTVFHSKFYGSIDAPDTPKQPGNPPKKRPQHSPLQELKDAVHIHEAGFWLKNPFPKIYAGRWHEAMMIFSRSSYQQKRIYIFFSNKGEGVKMNRQVVTIDSIDIRTKNTI